MTQNYTPMYKLPLSCSDYSLYSSVPVSLQRKPFSTWADKEVGTIKAWIVADVF